MLDRTLIFCMLGLALLFSMKTFAQSERVSVDQAIQVLESSLDTTEIERAIADLEAAGEEAAPAAPILARMIAAKPNSPYIAIALGATGEACIPLVGELVLNGFEWAVTCGERTVKQLPRGLDDELWAVLDPAVAKPQEYEGSINALMVMGHYDFSTETANRLLKRYLTEEKPALRPFAAMAFGFKADDPELFALMEKHDSRYNDKLMAFLGAMLKERNRRGPIIEHYGRSKLPKPLPEEIRKRFEEEDAKLKRLANDAFTQLLETLEFYTRGGNGGYDFNQYFYLRVTYMLAAYGDTPTQELIKTLTDVQRKRGSRIDQEIMDLIRRLRFDEMPKHWR